MLDSLERERDTARADVQRLIEERDVLYERLKVIYLLRVYFFYIKSYVIIRY